MELGSTKPTHLGLVEIFLFRLAEARGLISIEEEERRLQLLNRMKGKEKDGGGDEEFGWSSSITHPVT